MEDDKPVTLYDEDGTGVKFDQVAIIPLKTRVYAILKPIDEMEGVADDEAIVFCLMEDESGEDLLSVEQDEVIIKKIFESYYEMLDVEKEKASKKKKSKK